MKFNLNLIYATLFCVAQPVWAEQKAETNQLDEIVIEDTGIKQNGYQTTGTSIVSKAEVPIIDTPNTVNVLSTQLLQDRQPDSLIDALYNVSGVSQANTLGGIFDAIQKRGFGANRDNSIMRNGLQAGPSHNFGATTETVEVLKGPASVLYGIQDPGGVINVVTKKPQQKPKYVVGGSVGNNNAWGTQLDFTGGLGNGFAYRFIYDKQDKDYWRNFGKINRTTYAPSISWENDKTKVLVAYEHLDYKEPFDRGTNLLTATGELPNISVKTRLDEPYNVTTGKTDTLQAKIEHKLDDTWKLNAMYGYSRSLYSYNQARITKIDVKKRTATRQFEQQNNGDQRVHSGSLNLVGEFAIGDIANRLVVGVDAMRNIRDLGPVYNSKANTQYDLNIDNPVYVNPPIPKTNTNNNAYQYNHLKTLGAYIQDTAYLTEKVIVTGGLRYEYFDQVAGRHGLTQDAPPSTNQSDGKLLYQLGAVYKFTPNLTSYANYAESFRPQYSVSTPVDSSLKAEQGKSFEIGSKYENDRLNATVALFNIDKRNVAESFTDKFNNTYLVIAGKQRSRGVEFDLNGQLTENLSLSTNYTYTKAKTLENNQLPNAINKQLSGVPKHQASLFLGYNIGEFTFGKIRIGGGARYLGSWHAYTSEFDKSYKIPHAVVYDAFATYDTKVLDKKVSFQLNAKNLSNKTYFPSTSGNATSNIIPVALGYGREIMLSSKIEF